jgi:hypothetical protein
MDGALLEFSCPVDDFFERHRSALFLRSFPTHPKTFVSFERHAVLFQKYSTVNRFAGEFI